MSFRQTDQRSRLGSALKRIGLLGFFLVPLLSAADSPTRFAQSWAIPDLDGDRIPEAARATQNGWDIKGFGHSLELRMSQGGLPQSLQFHTVTSAPLSFSFRDLDGDLDLDLVVTTGVFHQIVGVWLNDGGNLTPASVDQFAGSVWQTSQSFGQQDPTRLRLTVLPTRSASPASLFADSHPIRLLPSLPSVFAISDQALSNETRPRCSRAPPLSR